MPEIENYNTADVPIKLNYSFTYLIGHNNTLVRTTTNNKQQQMI